MRARLILVAVLIAVSPVGAQDPDEKAKRLAEAKSQVEKQLNSLESSDMVVRGEALEVIAEVGPDLPEVGIEGLALKVREAGLRATERFVAVLAGEILNRLDPQGTIDWLKQKAFEGGSAMKTRMGLAILSEIPDERAGRIAASYATEGSVGTRVQALLALAKLRQPGTTNALIACLGSTDREVKDNAAMALGRLGDTKAIPNLLSHLEDKDGDHASYAAWALKQFPREPRIFSAVAGNLKDDGGAVGDAKARIVESCAMTEHVDDLRGILKGSRSTKYRSAAALALGRLGDGDDETQSLLLTGILKERDERVRWACFFGLQKCVSMAVAPELLRALPRYAGATRQGQHHVFRMLAFLAGDLGLVEAAPVLLQAARFHKEDKYGLTWRVAAVNFWRCAAAPDDINGGARYRRKLKDDFDAADDERQIARLAEILGRSHRVEEFEYLIKQFRRFREGSAASLSVEKALEHMTGHFFGPSFGIWKHWLKKNPGFFDPREYRIDRRKWQKEFGKKDREFRQTKETERAVQLGLAWLARHQAPQGAIDPNRFFDQCRERDGCVKTGSRQWISPVGPSSLAALAYLGAGYSPEGGKFKDTVRRLLTYLEVRQLADGNIRTTDRFQGYSRPIAMYALAEAYNITGDDRYRPYLRRGIDFFVEIQNELGGWHYKVGSRETDTSVMSWVLLGLGVAHKSGFYVPESIFEGCDMILDKYSEEVGKEREVYQDIDPHYAYEVGEGFQGEYQTGYQSTVSENATTSFGLMARMFLGWRRSHPFCIGSAKFVLANNMERIPKGKNWGKYVSQNRFPSYAWYYGTLAMHQMGGRFFRQWNAVIKELLPNLQATEGCDAGSWPVLNYDFVGGKVYSTCMGVLTLETYYRYKPFCEEGLPEEEKKDD